MSRIFLRLHGQKIVEMPFCLFTRPRLLAKKRLMLGLKSNGDMLNASMFQLLVISCCEFLKPIQKLAACCLTQCCAENRPRQNVTRRSIYHDTVLHGKLNRCCKLTRVARPLSMVVVFPRMKNQHGGQKTCVVATCAFF